MDLLGRMARKICSYPHSASLRCTEWLNARGCKDVVMSATPTGSAARSLSASAPSLNTVRKVIDDLCDLWDRSADATASFREGVDERRAVGIHTHAHHAVRLARALRALDIAGFNHEMTPLVRQIFEDGITAAWLLLTPGSGDILIKDGAKQRAKAQRMMLDLGHIDVDSPGWKQSAEVLKNLASVPSSYQMPTRCSALQDGDNLYLTYRALSMETHSGLGVADLYSLEAEQSPIGVAFDPDPDFPARTSFLGTAACLLLLGINADEQARARPRRTTQIAKAAKRMGVSTRILDAEGRDARDLTSSHG